MGKLLQQNIKRAIDYQSRMASKKKYAILVDTGEKEKDPILMYRDTLSVESGKPVYKNPTPCTFNSLEETIKKIEQHLLAHRDSRIKDSIVKLNDDGSYVPTGRTYRYKQTIERI